MMYLIKFNNIRARQGLITNKIAIVRVAVRATMLIAYANCHIFPIYTRQNTGLQPAHL